MDYVCNVVGDLEISDINLKLSFKEKVRLEPEDFKSSPRLREALRNKEIQPYDPSQHHLFVKSISTYRTKEISNNVTKTAEFKEINVLRGELQAISKKMDSLISRTNLLVAKSIESLEVSTKINGNIEKIVNKHDGDFLKKINKILEYQEGKGQKDEESLLKLIGKIDDLITKGLPVKEKPTYKGNGSSEKFDDVPKYVPELKTENVSRKNIVTKEVKSEGTEEILEKLNLLNKD